MPRRCLVVFLLLCLVGVEYKVVLGEEPSSFSLQMEEPSSFSLQMKDLASQGDVEKQFNLGTMYQFDIGVPQNYAEALKWFRLAAAQGNANAQAGLGVMYLNGQGVSYDPVEALKWHRLAAAQGNEVAQFFLGVMYQLSLGVSKTTCRPISGTV